MVCRSRSGPDPRVWQEDGGSVGGRLDPLVLLRARSQEPHPPALPSAADSSPAAGAGAIRVLIVDDHKLLREGLRALLEQQPGIEVVGEAQDGQEALELADSLRPDVITMDVTMPRMSGLDATRRLAQSRPEARVVGLSMHEDEAIAAAMRRAGAVAFVAKSAPAEDLLTAIRQAGPRPDRGSPANPDRPG